MLPLLIAAMCVSAPGGRLVSDSAQFPRSPIGLKSHFGGPEFVWMRYAEIWSAKKFIGG